MLPSIEQRLALELAAKPAQVSAAIALLDEGATVPFIARYRKEATGGLDDIQLRLLEERLRYLRELEDRRAAIVASITEQNKMTPVFQLAQVAQAFFQQAQLDVVEAARCFLAITRDERHGGAFVEQGDGGGNLGRFGSKFEGEALFDGRQHERGS